MSAPKDLAYHDDSSPQKNGLKLTLGAIGIVFGDIGTSPLYALRECLAPERGVAATTQNVIGIVSLLVWLLTLVVCVKYLSFVLKADNRGEGGILALVSLVASSLKKKTGSLAAGVALLGIVGAALLYSDGILTPAISVLSAVEGLQTITPAFQPWIVPLALIILVTLFAFQSRGTSKVASFFGPVLVVWFVTIGTLGFAAILRSPAILAVLNPWNAIQFVSGNLTTTFTILGAVFLSVTGTEVLYADLGHFGTTPVRRGWYFLVFPALILNYIGQGAFLLAEPTKVDHLFFQLAPEWFKYPLVIIATMATVIASQAVISGAFSLARQSVQLGFWPRMQVRHTSNETIGQVYVPFINWCLMIGTVALVLLFRESGHLASAYGIAVSADMLITTCLMMFIAHKRWKASLLFLIPLGTMFFLIDSNFFVANAGKVFSGGWIVVLTAAFIFTLMKTWRDGRQVLRKTIEASVLSLTDFMQSISRHPPVRVKRTAVFLSGNPRGVPTALLHNLKHNRILHETTILVSVQTDETPRVGKEHRAVVQDYGMGLWQVILHFGFSELPNIPVTLKLIRAPGLNFDPHQTTYFLGRESLIIAPHKKTMSLWRKKLFWFMSHNALAATSFYHLPANQVVEISAQTEL